MHGRARRNSGALDHVVCRPRKIQECFPSEAIHIFNVYSHSKELRHSVFVNSMQGWLKSYMLYYLLKEFINFQPSAQKMVMEFVCKK